jgi:hypothetical protein
VDARERDLREVHARWRRAVRLICATSPAAPFTAIAFECGIVLVITSVQLRAADELCNIAQTRQPTCLDWGTISLRIDIDESPGGFTRTTGLFVSGVPPLLFPMFEHLPGRIQRRPQARDRARLALAARERHLLDMLNKAPGER